MAVTPDEKQAARAYLEHDYAAHNLKGEAAQAANDNARAIDEEHERARDIALTGTADELGELPKHLRAHQLRSRKQAGISTQHAARIRSGYRTPEGGRTPAARRQAAAPERRTARTVTASAGRSAASAGSSVLDAAGDSSIGGLTVTAIGWAMGLSLLYLVLRNAGSLSRITTGVANATRAVVAVNVDPLNPHLTAKR